jgi:hypothetical protein
LFGHFESIVYILVLICYNNKSCLWNV